VKQGGRPHAEDQVATLSANSFLHGAAEIRPGASSSPVKQAATPRIYQAPEIRPPGRPRPADLPGAEDPFIRGSVRQVGRRAASEDLPGAGDPFVRGSVCSVVRHVVSAAGLRVVEEAGRHAGEDAGRCCQAKERGRVGVGRWEEWAAAQEYHGAGKSESF
jgi:hypothetical protein